MYRRVAREAEGSHFEGFHLASGFGIGRLEGREERIGEGEGLREALSVYGYTFKTLHFDFAR